MRSLATMAMGIGFSGMVFAQGVDPKDLIHPPSDSWLTYHGDYSGGATPPSPKLRRRMLGN